jgi:4-hydroxy-tetrahydrodipicolinate synthase
MKELKGICAAVCTPFKDGTGSVDEIKFKKHMDTMLDAGMHAILVCGGTGEFAYLRPDERIQIAEMASKHIDDRAYLVVQTSSNSTSDAVYYARHAEDIGAHCLLMLPPFFEGPDASGVYYHYEEIAKAVDIPVMVYNIPVHSGFDITPEFFKRLMEIDNILYIKDSTCDLVRIQNLISIGANVFNGADPIAFYSLLAGCEGCVWGAPNVMPNETVELYNLVTKGDLNKARDLWKRMLPANIFFWSHIYNSSVKAATNLAGKDVGYCRKPVLPLNDSEMIDLKESLKPLGY